MAGIKLTRGWALDDAERTLLSHAAPVFLIVKRRLEAHIEALRTISEGEDSFSEVNWPEKQAYTLGQIKALKSFLNELPKGDIYE